MSGAFGGPPSGQSELNRIVDALQQMVRLQGATYQLLLQGVAVLPPTAAYPAAVNDAAAAAAGVPLWGLYQNAGALRQRIV